jgi:hypothetical protein
VTGFCGAGKGGLCWAIRLFPAGLALLIFAPSGGRAQAARRMEEPYGFAGALHPTGHDALYFARICAATPIHLRRCRAGELGSVIARYHKVEGHDRIAIPLIAYFYSVEQAADVPRLADLKTVHTLRRRYIEAFLANLKPPPPVKGRVPGHR